MVHIRKGQVLYYLVYLSFCITWSISVSVLLGLSQFLYYLVYLSFCITWSISVSYICENTVVDSGRSDQMLDLSINIKISYYGNAILIIWKQKCYKREVIIVICYSFLCKSLFTSKINNFFASLLPKAQKCGMSESSFTCLGLRASGLAQRLD